MNKQFDNILDWTASEHSIVCSKCKHTSVQSLVDDAYEAVTNFIKDGWRCPRQIAYCPKCAKKHLKPRKK